MVTVNITVTDEAVQPGVYLGRQGEKQAREIVLDLSAMREKYGAGTATLYHQRSKDPAPYLIGETTGTTLTWTVSETDTVYAGIGYCEVRYTFGTEGLSKSAMFATNVKASLSGDVIIPAATQAWYDALIDYIDTHRIAQEQLAQAVADYIDAHPLEGIPSGGTEGQIIVKKSGTDYDAEWGDDLSDLKSAIDYYLNGVDASYPIIGGASKRIEFPFLKDAIYTITNNTDNNCWNLRVYKKDGTTTVIDSTFASNESVSYVPATDDIIAFGGYFDGTGTVSVKCNYKGLQVDITPELFGAVGDGTTNDKTALQNSIDYCIAHNQPLYFNAKSRYAVGDQIKIVDPTTNFHIYGNGASIVALTGYSLSAYKCCVYITQTGTRYADMTYLENIKIDCNNVCAGLQVDHGYDFTFENINVRNCKTVAINCVSGGECYFNNIAIHCVHNSGNSTGLQIQSSDYHFTDVVIIDADRAIYNASSSMYTRVHAWNTSGCAGTYYFVHNAGYPVLVQCHADTYETAYYRETDRPIMLIGCVYYINSNLYDSSTTPVVFKFASTSIGYSGNIKCVDCIFDALRTEVNMAESVHKIQLINCSKKGTVNLYNNGTNLSLSNGATDTGLSVNANSITQEGDYLHYYFIFNLTNVDLTGTNPKTIGTISNSRFRPKAFMVYPCMFVTDEYATNVISGYITINNSNGVVQVKPNTAGAYKKLIADFREYRPLSMYEA